MNPVLIAQLINAAFSVIAGARRFVGDNARIVERLDQVDAGGEAITVAEAQAALDDLQSEIDRGRNLPWLPP